MRVGLCPICRTVIRKKRAVSTCSFKCAQALAKKRDPRKYHENRVKAGFKSGVKSRDRSITHWSKKFPGVDIVSVRRIFAAGYSAGTSAGHKRGFEQGWAAGEAAERMRRPA